MMQRFVDHDPEEHYFTLLDEHDDAFRRIAAFDVVINNTDRKGGHCLRDQADDIIFGIDHGVSFHDEWKLRTVIWEFAGERLSAAAADDVCRVVADLHGGRCTSASRPCSTTTSSTPSPAAPRCSSPGPAAPRRLAQHPLAPRLTSPPFGVADPRYTRFDHAKTEGPLTCACRRRCRRW